MLLFIFLFWIVESEWVGILEFHVEKFQIDHLVRIYKPNIPVSRVSGYLCHPPDYDCPLKPIILVAAVNSSATLNEALLLSNSKKAKALVVITDMQLDNWPKNILGFKLPTANGQVLLKKLSDNPHQELAHISYFFKYHCEIYNPIIYEYIVLSIVWALILGLWLYNSYVRNLNFADMNHKYASLILAFKTIELLSSLFFWSSCPYNQIISQLFSLLKDQCRALYETSLFAYIMALSKGWHLSISAPNRNEFSYIIMLTVVIYVFDCALNLIESSMSVFILSLFLVIFSHSFYFSFKTLKVLKNQYAIVRESGDYRLFRVVSQKIKLFRAFVGILSWYVIGELIFHGMIWFYEIDEINDEDRNTELWIGIHESLEIITFTFILYLLRARSMGPYFSLTINPESHSKMIPFYEASRMAPTERSIVAIQLPSEIVLGKLIVT
ncbi:unnamed protein product [Blepharisma stoltei]|uniref:Uncharacterized protein n=1 Tax=Blepharisma stoltei TaxID=1481888 RepID=A0AAU9ICD1_9CILI|nr:unnamed protein product [Blepharisma stoltei]